MKRTVVILFSAIIMLVGTGSYAAAQRGGPGEQGNREIPVAQDNLANNECEFSTLRHRRRMFPCQA